MPPLHNSRWERFAQALFEGKSADEAYETAGYSANRGNASRLKANENILTRLTELQLAAQKSNEVTVASLLGELEEARVKATSLNQLSASVRATAEKARISGLLIERVEVGKPGSFDDIDNLPDIISKIRQDIGDDGAELLCAVCGLNEKGEKVVNSVSSLSFRRKLARYRQRVANESIIRDAIGPSIDVEITPGDVAELRGLMRQFDDLVEGIKARSAKLVSTVNPVEIERKRLNNERKRLFGGNGRQR